MLDLGRPKSQWLEIFYQQTDGTPEGVGNRILGDMWGYGTRTDRYRKQDAESLGNALEAYRTFVAAGRCVDRRKMARHILLVAAAALTLAACQSPDRATTIYYDQANRLLPQPLTVVHTGADGNGTPLLTLVGQYDPRGAYRLIYGGTGEDYFAGFSRGGLAGAFEGAGIAGFGALVRPAKTVFSNVGNSRATGGSATGGTASARARGGNANAVARQGQSQSQHQNATATSDAAAHSASSSTGGGIIPNGTTLHTPNGDIVVDPTVSVSQ